MHNCNKSINIINKICDEKVTIFSDFHFLDETRAENNVSKHLILMTESFTASQIKRNKSA